MNNFDRYEAMIFHVFDLNLNIVTTTENINDCFELAKKDKVFVVNLKNKLIADKEHSIFKTISTELWCLLLAAFPNINTEDS